MVGINPSITRKIQELIGKDAPDNLMEFFNEILKLEAKNETTMDLSKKDMQGSYQSIVDKYSQNEKIIKFLKSNTKETTGGSN